MRAVNLLPPDQRRGGASGTRSGVAVYAVLGALAALVVAVGAYVLATNQVSSSRTELAQAEQEAVSLEQQAAAFKPYKEFADLSETRIQTVAQLAASRFDWERVMRELARALPGDVWLTSLVGTVGPGVTLDGSGTGATGALRGSMPNPAVEIVGCTESQSQVSRVMARLRTLNGVQRVALASSEKSDATGGGGGGAPGAASSGDCRNGSARFPQFQLIVFFEAPKAMTGAAGAAPGAATAAAPAAQGAAK